MYEKNLLETLDSIIFFHFIFKPNQFIRQILDKNPYSKSDNFKMCHKIDETNCFLMNKMLKTVPQNRACEIIAQPNHLGISFVFYSTRLYYRSTKMLLGRFPELKFNQIGFFGNTAGLIFTTRVVNLPAQLFLSANQPFLKFPQLSLLSSANSEFFSTRLA